jgi:hypothetical protein
MSDLNLSNYTTTQTDDFTQSSSLANFSLFWAVNGNVSFDSNGATLTAGSGGGVGFLQAPYQAQTYGLYQVTAKLEAGQSNGAAVVLWPANNVWPGPEVDLMESFDTSRQSAYTTIHWNDNGNNDYDAHNFTLDATQWHTYAYDWEPGSLTYYIDGHEMFSTTDHVPSSPLEFGAEIAAPDGTVSLQIQSMSISTLNPGAQSAPAPQADAAPAPAPAADATPSGAPATIAVSDTGSNGNDVTATVNAAGLSNVNYAVFTSDNVALTGWNSVSLDGNGNATINATLGQGEYLNVTDPSGNVPGAWLSGTAASPNFISVDDNNTNVSGGNGTDLFAYQGGSAQDVISNFSLAAGDVLQIPTALQGSMQQAQSGNDTVISFGSDAGSITLTGITSLPSSSIHYA